LPLVCQGTICSYAEVVFALLGLNLLIPYAKAVFAITRQNLLKETRSAEKEYIFYRHTKYIRAGDRATDH
jgi:hypothetical protein